MADYTLSNSDIIKGGHLMVFVEGKPLAFSVTHNFNKSLQTQEVSAKDFGDFGAVLPQKITWEASTENLFAIGTTGCPGFKALNDAFNDMREVDVYFGETTYNQETTQDSIVGATGVANWTYAQGATGVTPFGEHGKAYITALNVTAGAGENATFSATFTGNGSLSSGHATE